MQEYINGQIFEISQEDEAECARLAEEAQNTKNIQDPLSRIEDLEEAMKALLLGLTE